MDFKNLNKVFIIAEIGQNHQGDFDLAKEMILKAKEANVDCVKFQKSSLKHKFTKSALEKSYNSVNSWGKTYGQHKEHLEFNIDQYKLLKDYAESLGLIFSASAMDIVSYDELNSLNLKFIKIGSGDTNNIPMIKYIAQKSTPLIVSTGMQTEKTIQQVQNILEAGNAPYALLHCVSSYPCSAEDVRLGYITRYQKMFPNTVIGYSGHEKGITISLAAVLLGAKIIERHFTLDKKMKGSDHEASLNPEEMESLIKQIRSIENQKIPACPTEISKILNENVSFIENLISEVPPRIIFPCEIPCNEKLGKSLTFANNLKAGNVLIADDIAIKVAAPKGIPGEFFEDFIGKCLARDVLEDDIVNESDFC